MTCRVVIALLYAVIRYVDWLIIIRQPCTPMAIDKLRLNWPAICFRTTRNIIRVSKSLIPMRYWRIRVNAGRRLGKRQSSKGKANDESEGKLHCGYFISRTTNSIS